jgi:phosphohistidine phosphatase
MLLTLVRHGDAGMPSNGLGDSGRWLSRLGREQARATGRALAERGVAPTLAWSSPLVRAVQTAELILGSLAYAGTLEARDDLFPDSPPRSLVRALADVAADADVLVVGHMPYMPGLASQLLDVQVSSFSTGEAYRLQLAAGALGSAQLAWRV